MKGIKVKITEETHSKAKLLAGCGLRDEEIAQVLGMSEATLKRKCAQALVSGRCVALATVGVSLLLIESRARFVAWQAWAKHHLEDPPWNRFRG